MRNFILFIILSAFLTSCASLQQQSESTQKSERFRRVATDSI